MGKLTVTLLAGPDEVRLRPGRDGWQLALLEGWRTLPDSKAVLTERPRMPGAIHAPTTARQSLAIRVGVEYRGDTDRAAAKALEQLQRVITTPRLTVSVSDHDMTTERVCYAAGLSDPEMHLPCEEWSATIDLIAPDPRRYSPGEMIVGASVTIRNTGNAPLHPVVAVSSMGAGVDTVTVREVETDRRMVFVRRNPANGAAEAFSASDVLTLNPETGQARINGELRLGLTRAEWPEVPPATQRTYTTSSGSLQVLQRSAWW